MPPQTDTPDAAPAILHHAAPDPQTWLWLGGSALVAILLTLVIHYLLFRILNRIAGKQEKTFLHYVILRLNAPSRLALPLLGLHFVLSSADNSFDSPFLTAAIRFSTVALIIALTWAAIRTVAVIDDLIRGRRRIDVSDNLQARRIHTQVTVLSRTFSTILAIVGAAVALMTFPQVRQVGASLLASAGIAGIIAGIAARPIAENLLAGIQIAFTEPIRLDDIVVVEGQWGRIEEITPAYIVVRVWDERRLVVPLSYFITKPVENWTRSSSSILTTAYIYVDYSVPIPRIREELKSILESTPHWDGRTWALQVTDATAGNVQLRALMSAADGFTAFDLKCEVRERLIDFLQREFPGSPPHKPASETPKESPTPRKA